MPASPPSSLQPTSTVRLRFAGTAAMCGHAFNPTLLRTTAGLVCLFRGVTPAGDRKVYRCGLTAALEPTGEPHDWTAELTALGSGIGWVADPRAFTFQGRWFVTFNTGHSRRPNDIFVVEIDATGRPAGVPTPVQLTTSRRMIEKNWGFFQDGSELYAIYSLDPLRILRCRFTPDGLVCAPAWRHDWLADQLREAYGPLHGGSSPCLIDGRLLTVFQSRRPHDAGFEYAGNVLELEAAPPFAPVAVGPHPLFSLDDEESRLQPERKLNPRVAECLYPAGLAPGPEAGRLSISYGINDFACGGRTYATADVLAALTPVTRIRAALAPSAPSATPVSPAAAVRTFYWRPRRAIVGGPDELAAGRFVFGNVGDSLQRHLNAALFGMRTLHAEQGSHRLLGAGSIAHRVRPGDVFWGSGFKDVPLQLTAEEKESIAVRAVRGPLTADYLTRNGVRVPTDVAFFDPGLIVAEALPTEMAACRREAPPAAGILLVPHYKHTRAWLDQFSGAGRRLRTVDCDLFDMIREMLSANLVVSSSLHGIVLAEAVGVPAVLLRPPTTEPTTKYDDYYLGTGRPTFPVIDHPDEAAQVRIPELPQPPRGWRRSLPTDHELAAKGISVPIRELDGGCVVDVPGSPTEAMLDIGSQAGSRFVLDASVEAGGDVRVVLAVDATPLHDVVISASSPATLACDGQLIEERGGAVAVTAWPSAEGGAATLRLVARPSVRAGA